MNRTFNNPTEAFEGLCVFIHNNGLFSNGTKLIYNACFYVKEIDQPYINTPERNFNNAYASAEWLWYEKGDRNADSISEIAKIWKSMIVPNTNGEVNSNYGYFWKFNNQLQRVIDILEKDPQSRRAIVVHYDISELDRYAYDTPCNVVLNFYIENGRLNLSIFARSIDVVYGYCNDQYTFAMLQNMVSKKLKLVSGSCHWSITNLHAYERHYTMLEKINNRITGRNK